MDRAFNELAAYECSFEVRAFDLFEHGDDLVSRPMCTYDFGPKVKNDPGRMP
jgi:hypothetical protein